MANRLFLRRRVWARPILLVLLVAVPLLWWLDPFTLVIGAGIGLAVVALESVAEFRSSRAKNAADFAHLVNYLRVHGPDDPHSLFEVTYWLKAANNPASAAAALEKLLNRQMRALGPDHPDVLAARGYIAHWREQTRAD